MLELLLILGLVALGGVAIIAFVGFALKLVFKLLLLPFVAGLFLLKVILGLVLFVLALALAPVLVGLVLLIGVPLLVLGIPLLLLAGVLGLGSMAFGAA